ncbi:hypothetical protein D9758_016828 [Tetrapyrgos nigripes]|uniref:Uncharacterized protein n=1 Tax=Tetrapyrgos nigripes TaxID=182062 RepID=A0A8H5FI14_9AGAR|nr:hypothetical protein D9758_016828 [Tetrapyrgos nigripes]
MVLFIMWRKSLFSLSFHVERYPGLPYWLPSTETHTYCSPSPNSNRMSIGHSPRKVTSLAQNKENNNAPLAGLIGSKETSSMVTSTRVSTPSRISPVGFSLGDGDSDDEADEDDGENGSSTRSSDDENSLLSIPALLLRAETVSSPPRSDSRELYGNLRSFFGAIPGLPLAVHSHEESDEDSEDEFEDEDESEDNLTEEVATSPAVKPKKQKWYDMENMIDYLLDTLKDWEARGSPSEPVDRNAPRLADWLFSNNFPHHPPTPEGLKILKRSYSDSSSLYDGEDDVLSEESADLDQEDSSGPSEPSLPDSPTSPFSPLGPFTIDSFESLFSPSFPSSSSSSFINTGPHGFETSRPAPPTTPDTVTIVSSRVINSGTDSTTNGSGGTDQTQTSDVNLVTSTAHWPNTNTIFLPTGIDNPFQRIVDEGRPLTDVRFYENWSVDNGSSSDHDELGLEGASESALCFGDEADVSLETDFEVLDYMEI